MHFHQLFIDGAYGLDDNKFPTEFHALAPPTMEELDGVLKKIIQKVTRYLEKQKIIIRDEVDNLQIHLSGEDAFTKLQASSSVYRFMTGPNKGKRALVLKAVDQDHSSAKGLVVKDSGFSLPAGVACKADERKKLERICRYIARPAVSEERLSVNAMDQVLYKLKKAYEDGTTHIVMEPIELLEKLAAIVPRPWVHLTRFYRILAPHDKHRSLVVPRSACEAKREFAKIPPESAPLTIDLKVSGVPKIP